MKKDSSSSEANKELKEVIRQGIPKMSRTNFITTLMLCDLKSTLNEMEQSRADGENFKATTALKGFDGLIDKKYWNDAALFYLITSLCCGVAKSLDEAIAMYEDFCK